MKINQEFFIYPVGTFYDPNFESYLDPGSKYDLILYVNSNLEEKRSISSLEGYFISNKNLSKLASSLAEGNIPIRKENIDFFESKYEGKFYLNKK